MNSPKNKPVKYQPERQWLQMLTSFVVLVALVVGGFTLWTIDRSNSHDKKALQAAQADQRKQRIEAIFDSFGLDDSYKVTKVDIAGDKQVYAWDDGRSYTSSIEYMRFEEVDETVKLTKRAIEDAGFEVMSKPLPDSVNNQYIFKNSSHEHIIMTVTSREVNDALLTGDSIKDIDENASPSVVLLKVNLGNSGS